MKTIRLLLLAALVALSFACSNDPVSDSQPDPPSGTDPHKVPVASALADPDAMLAAIDGPETRGMHSESRRTGSQR